MNRFLVLLLTFGVSGASAYEYQPAPMQAGQTAKELENIGIDDKLGALVDTTTIFTDDNGAQVSLAQVFEGKKPILFTIVYYSCPGLCSYHLNGLNEVFKKLKWTAGKDFKVVALSMNHREDAKLAHEKKLNYIKEYGRSDVESGWHFLTGTEANVKKIADQVGFKFRWDESQKQYAHASAAILMTPKGQVSRYLYGIDFDANTLKYALVESGEGHVGSVVDKLILYCFHFDPNKNKYTMAAFNVMRLGGVLIIIALGGLLVPFWIRERKKHLRQPIKGES